MSSTETQLNARLIRYIRPGDRVTILIPNGIGRDGVEYKEKSGRAVICNPDTVALNMGGPHGTPGVATTKNLVSAPAAMKRMKAMEARNGV